MRRKQFTALPWLFLVVRDPHSRPKQEWPPLVAAPFVPAQKQTIEAIRAEAVRLAFGDRMESEP